MNQLELYRYLKGRFGLAKKLESNPNDITGWVYEIDANKLLGKFRTKQDALKFAINWMRKHPNG